MRALICREYGPPDVLKLENVPQPSLPAGNVRIAVSRTTVTFAVILGLAGKHQNKPGLPYIPGGEVTGKVIEVAADVQGFTPGQRVVAMIGAGGYAEQAVAPAANCWAIPEALSDEHAIVTCGTHASLFLALDWLARLQAGETLLVHGAGGGSGLGAVILGKAMGARVIASAGGPEKLAVARRNGAAETIDYRNEAVRERVLALTGGRGADVVFDPVGGEAFEQSLRCVAPEGRLIPYGFAGGTIPQIPANILLVKNISVIGFYWGYYLGWGKQKPPQATTERLRATMAMLLQWSLEGRLPPMPCTVLPMENCREALRLVAEREAIGKILLAI